MMSKVLSTFDNVLPVEDPGKLLALLAECRRPSALTLNCIEPDGSVQMTPEQAAELVDFLMEPVDEREQVAVESQRIDAWLERSIAEHYGEPTISDEPKTAVDLLYGQFALTGKGRRKNK